MKNKRTMILIGIIIVLTWGFNDFLFAKKAFNNNPIGLDENLSPLFYKDTEIIFDCENKATGIVNKNRLIALNRDGNNDILKPSGKYEAGKLNTPMTPYGNNYSINEKNKYDKENNVYSNPNATDYAMERKIKGTNLDGNKVLSKDNSYFLWGIGFIVLLLLLFFVKKYFFTKKYKICINQKFVFITYVVAVIVKFAFFLPTNYYSGNQGSTKYISSFEYFNSSQINYSKLAIELIILTLISGLFYFIIKNKGNKIIVIIDLKETFALDKSLNKIENKKLLINKLKNPLLWISILLLDTLFYLFAYFFNLLNFEQLLIMPSFIFTFLLFSIPFLLFFLYKCNFLSLKKNTEK